MAMATIINGKNALKSFLSANSGKTVGVCTSGIVSKAPDTMSKKVSLDALYTLTKMKTLNEINICCPYELPTGDSVSAEEFLNVVNENMEDYLCDYVYVETDQLGITGFKERENSIFVPFIESSGICQITRYLPYNMPFLFTDDPIYIIDVNRKYINQLPYFKWIPAAGEFNVKNEKISVISAINIETSTLEQVNQVISSYVQYYRILNLDGQSATIDDVRAGKAFVFIYETEADKNNNLRYKIGICWIGFGTGDVFNNTTREIERNVCSIGLDFVLDSKWVNVQTTSETWRENIDIFKSDIRIYYSGI
jgi:hypothetical protein